jgi:hypothetical protein
MSAVPASHKLRCVKCHAVYITPNKRGLCFMCLDKLLRASEPPDDVHIVESIQADFRSRFFEKDWPAFVPSSIARERYLGEELDEQWRGCLVEWLTSPVGEAGTPVPPSCWTSDERPTRVILRVRLWQPGKEGFIEQHWYDRDPRPMGLNLLTPAGRHRSGKLEALMRPRRRPGRGTGDGAFPDDEFERLYYAACRKVRQEHGRPPTKADIYKYHLRMHRSTLDNYLKRLHLPDPKDIPC